MEYNGGLLLTVLSESGVNELVLIMILISMFNLTIAE